MKGHFVLIPCLGVNNKTGMPMYLLPTWMNEMIFQKNMLFIISFMSTNFCGIFEFNKGLFLLEVCKKKKTLNFLSY